MKIRNALAGAAVATIALHGLQIGFSAYVRLFTDASRVVYGSFAILFFFVGCQFVAFGLLGEYIGRIYQEVRDRPRYMVKKIHQAK